RTGNIVSVLVCGLCHMGIGHNVLDRLSWFTHRKSCPPADQIAVGIPDSNAYNTVFCFCRRGGFRRFAPQKCPGRQEKRRYQCKQFFYVFPHFSSSLSSVSGAEGSSHWYSTARRVILSCPGICFASASPIRCSHIFCGDSPSLFSSSCSVKAR